MWRDLHAPHLAKNYTSHTMLACRFPDKCQAPNVGISRRKFSGRVRSSLIQLSHFRLNAAALHGQHLSAPPRCAN